jgi:hypothetical protein
LGCIGDHICTSGLLHSVPCGHIQNLLYINTCPPHDKNLNKQINGCRKFLFVGYF